MGAVLKAVGPPPRTRDGGYRFSGGSERLPGARRRARSSSEALKKALEAVGLRE